MIYLMFLTAFTLSSVAAYYSIAGLTAIFSAAIIPIIIMGSTLEVAKLVVASWVYRNWKEIPVMLKSYFMIALIILMSLTSMGIFGYLSKAHLDQAVPSGDIAAKVSLIDEKIKSEKDTIDDAKRTIAQLDKQVNETIARTSNQTDTRGIDRSVSIRKSQGKERESLFKTISTAQTNIQKLNEERAPIASQLRKVEAEVGPIKYIAALIYGDHVDDSLLEKAVRIVILMIVSVFDPMAVLMLVAANWSLKHIRKEEYEHHAAGGDDPPEKARTPQEILDEGREVLKQYNMDYYSDSHPQPEQTIEDIVVDEYHEMLNDIKDHTDEQQVWNDFFEESTEEEPHKETIEEIIEKPLPHVDLEDPNAYISKTIEQEVEELQPSIQIKEVEYDSAGRRITPRF